MKRILHVLLSLLCVLSLSAQQRADSTLMRYLRGEGLLSYPARSVQIFTDGASTFDALFADIDRAESKVWVEFMIVANDSIGNALLSHLQGAASRGCEVRLIVDDYKDWERSYGFREAGKVDSIRGLGIDFVLFDRFRYPWLNHVCRDHRKIVVIDDAIGYIGGLNVADYYIHGKPSYGGWRDTHARITGAAVEGLALLFSEHYHRSGGAGAHSFARYRYADDYREAGSMPLIVYFERSRYSVKKQAETRNAIIAAFDAARDTIRFVTPYLLPTHTVRQAILRAIDRGVHVEVLFSKVGDNPMLSYGNLHFAKRLVKHGAHVFLYRGKFHHSKIMMVDGQFAMVGSANLNSRSLKWDYEASSFIFSQKVTAQLDSVFAEDKRQCDVFTPRYYKQTYSYPKRLAGWWIDRLFTPIL